MKKFLIATTALTLSAGVAAAEVKFGGDARLGLQYNSKPGAGNSKTKLEKRMTLNADASTTADNGVTFGARVRIRSDEVTGSAVSGARVYARFGGLTVAGGNILGAIESMPGLYAPSLGLTGLGYGGLVTNVGPDSFTAAFGTDTVKYNSLYDNWDAFSSKGNGAEGIEVLYSAGDFTGHMSYSSTKLRGIGGQTVDRLALYGAYNFQGWTVALGLQDSNADVVAYDVTDSTGALVHTEVLENSGDKIVLTATGKIGDFDVGFGAARNGKGTSKVNKIAINGAYTFGATTVSGYVATETGHHADVKALYNTLGFSKTTYGLGAAYDLGGGASVVGGVARTVQKATRADIGVSFRF